MFMFWGTQKQLVQENLNRLKGSIWILRRQARRARNPEARKRLRRNGDAGPQVLA